MKLQKKKKKKKKHQKKNTIISLVFHPDALSLSLLVISLLWHCIKLIRKGQCSMFGANGSATIDSGLLQLRALDWNVEGQCDNIIIIIPVYTSCIFFCRSWIFTFTIVRLCHSIITIVVVATYRTIQKLPTDHSLPSQLRQWACICQHWMDRLDWLYNRFVHQ